MAKMLNLNDLAHRDRPALHFISTALAAPIERVPSLPVYAAEGTRKSAHQRDILYRLRKIALRPPRKSAEVIRAGLSELLQDPPQPSDRSQSVGLLVPSAIGHWADPLLIRAEALLAAIVASVADQHGPEAWRLPKLDSGSAWQPVVTTGDRRKPRLLVRFRSEAAETLPSWFDDSLTWDQIFPDSVGRLRPWPFEPFSCSAHDSAIENMSWLHGDTPRWATRDRFSWNRSIEISAGVKWLAWMAANNLQPKITSFAGDDSLAFENAGDVLSRLTGAEWATLQVVHQTRQPRLIEYIPPDWREEADLYTGEDFMSGGLSGALSRRVSVQSSPAQGEQDLLVAHGYCGGRRVVSAWGRRSPLSDDKSYSVADVADLLAAFADAFVRASGELVDDSVLALLLTEDRQAASLKPMAKGLATSFLADNIAVWRRLTAEGPFSLMLDYRRPDLAGPRQGGELRGRIVDDRLAREPVVGRSLRSHPLGAAWQIPEKYLDATGRYVSLFPIWAGDNLFGLIEIIDEDDERDSTWPSLLKGLFVHLSQVLPHLGGMEARELEARRSLRHQIRPALNALDENTRAIIQLASAKRSSTTRRDLHYRDGLHFRILSDLREFLEGLTDSAGKRPESQNDPVLDFARKSIQSQPEKSPPVNVFGQLAAAFTGVGNMFAERNLRVSIAGVDEGLCLKVPAPVLQIALSNLASNAAKYAAAGTEVAASTKLTDKGVLILEISNIGADMTDRERDLIFNRNFRSFSAKNSTTKGEGLGLYHVKGVLKVLGGRVEYLTKTRAPRGAMTHIVRLAFPRTLVVAQTSGEHES